MRWGYRRAKAKRATKIQAALEWMSQHPEIASRLQAEADAHISWESMWLGLQDQTDIDIPLEVRWFLEKGIKKTHSYNSPIERA
jgi:hypothetical protein